VKSSGHDQVIDFAVQVASTSNPFPHRREFVLPVRNSMVGRMTVFDKNQAAVFLQNTLDFLECSSRLRNGAQRPCDHRSVDRVIRQRKAFFCGLD
jgi:hypothetical protein